MRDAGSSAAVGAGAPCGQGWGQGGDNKRQPHGCGRSIVPGPAGKSWPLHRMHRQRALLVWLCSWSAACCMHLPSTQQPLLRFTLHPSHLTRVPALPVCAHTHAHTVPAFHARRLLCTRPNTQHYHYLDKFGGPPQPPNTDWERTMRFGMVGWVALALRLGHDWNLDCPLPLLPPLPLTRQHTPAECVFQLRSGRPCMVPFLPLDLDCWILFLGRGPILVRWVGGGGGGGGGRALLLRCCECR